MPVFTVDDIRCIRCGLCGLVCPSSIIAAVKGKLPRMRKGREKDCIGCGHCMIHCPNGSAHVDVLAGSECAPVDAALIPSAESVDMLCKSRRSIRRFKRASVPKEILEAVLDVARYAPSAKNRQPLRWIALYERNTLLRLGDLMADWFESLLQQPEGPLPHTHLKLLSQAWRSGDDPIFRGAPHLVLAISPKGDIWEGVDSSIALTYLELAAAGRSVGCCWAGYVTLAAKAHPPIQGLLGLGPEEIISGGQMMGYAAVSPRSIPPRTPLRLEWV